MGDNDLVRRGDVKAKKVYCDERHEYVVPVAEIDWLRPAIPQEMSARELYSAYMRICEEYNHKGKPVRCDECPLYIHCPRIGGALRMVVMCSPIVEKWAKEHPERRSE